MKEAAERVCAPVIVFAYNRVEHLRKTLEALDKNKLAEYSELFIFSDGPKMSKDASNVKKVRSAIKTYCDTSRFRKVNIYESKENTGLAVSIINGVSQIIQRYGKVIVLEDDIITSEDFLMFLNDALDYYEDNKLVWSISGYTFADKTIRKYCKEDIFLFGRGSSWGWGTWNDRWSITDWNVSDYEEFKKNKSKRDKFAESGTDLPALLDAQMNGEIDSWSIRFDYEESKRNMFTVYPLYPKAINIGLDGSGQHCWNMGESQVCILRPIPYQLNHIDPDIKIIKFCTKVFSPDLSVKARVLKILNIIIDNLFGNR